MSSPIVEWNGTGIEMVRGSVRKGASMYDAGLEGIKVGDSVTFTKNLFNVQKFPHALFGFRNNKNMGNVEKVR
jgi:hypothetical protein